MPFRYSFLSSMLLILFSSCTTIFTKSTYRLPVSGDENYPKVIYNHNEYLLPATIVVTKSKEPIILHAGKDTIMEKITVRPSPDPRFLFGNLSFCMFAPAAYAIDFTNQRRFYYGRRLELSKRTVDSTGVINVSVNKSLVAYWSQKKTWTKGSVYTSFLFPFVNNFYYPFENERPSAENGFLGIGAEVEYVVKNNRSIGVDIESMEGLLGPVVGNYYDKADTARYTSALNIGFSYNYKFRRFLVGYGAHFTSYLHRLTYTDAADNYNEQQTRFTGFGPSVKVGFQCGEPFYAGFRYSPTIYSTGSDGGWKYQHLISFEFALKLRMRKGH